MITNGPFTIQAGENTITQLGYSPDIAAIVIMNESPYHITARLPAGASSMPVTAGTADAFLVPADFTGSLKVLANAFLTATVQGAAPSSVIFVTTYARSEPLAQALLKGLPTGYPIALTRLTTVGNTVQTSGAVATSLVNDSSPQGTVIIETRVPNDNNPNFIVYNTGKIQVGMNQSSLAMLELGYQTPLQIDPPLNLISSGYPQLSVDINGVVTLSTNNNGHAFKVSGNASVALDTQYGAINIQNSGIVLNGGISGTATLIQDCSGSIKRVLVLLNNFRTGVGAQNIALPVAFTFGAQVFTGGIGNSANVGGVSFLSGGASQIVRVLTTLASTGGTVVGAGSNIMYENSFGFLIAGFDTLQFPGGSTTVHTGSFYIVGQ